MGFKVGDFVKQKQNCSGCKIGRIYPLHRGYKNMKKNENYEYKNIIFAWNKFIRDNDGCSCQGNWEPSSEKLYKIQQIKL